MPNGLPLYFLGCCERSFTQSLSFLCSWCWYNGYSTAQNCTGLQTQGLQFPSKLTGARHKSAERPPKNLIYTLFRNSINLESLTFSHEMPSWHGSCFGIALKEGITFSFKSDLFLLKIYALFGPWGRHWLKPEPAQWHPKDVPIPKQWSELGFWTGTWCRRQHILKIIAVYFDTLIRGWGHPASPGRNPTCEGIRESFFSLVAERFLAARSSQNTHTFLQRRWDLGCCY